MNNKKILSIIGSFTLSFIILGLTLAHLIAAHTTALNESATKTIFINTIDKSAQVVASGDTVKKRGTVRLGNYALFQLSDKNSELKLEKIEFDQKTQSIIHAHGYVNYGSVFAINLLFGPKLTLDNESVSVSNHGGSFIFEKNNNFTQVKGLSGNTQLTIYDPNSSETFEAILMAGKKVLLTDDFVSPIFATDDPVNRVLAWRNLLQNFDGHFEGESDLIGQLLDQFQIEKRGIATSILRWTQKKLLFTTEALNHFYSEEMHTLLGKIALGDTNNASEYLNNLSPKKRTKMETSIAHTIPYTRLFISKSLPPKMRQEIIRLAEFSPIFSELTGTAELPENIKLLQSLMFVISNPENAQYTKNFLDHTKQVTSPQLESSAQLIGLLLNDRTFNIDEWITAYHTLSTTRINTDIGLATAVLDQLALTKTFIRIGYKGLAWKTLHELANLIKEGNQKFSAVTLRQIAEQGDDLKNRIVFLSSAYGSAPINEHAYRIWLTTEKTIQAPTEKDDLDNKMSAEKPSSEFKNCGVSESFLNPVLNEILPELDSGLVCLGMSLCECKPTKILLKTINDKEVEMMIEGGSNEACFIGMKHLSTEEDKQYTGEFIRCSVDLEMIKNQSLDKNPTNEPGTFAASVYSFLDMESMNPETKCEIGLLEDPIEKTDTEEPNNPTTEDNDIAIEKELTPKTADPTPTEAEKIKITRPQFRKTSKSLDVFTELKKILNFKTSSKLKMINSPELLQDKIIRLTN